MKITSLSIDCFGLRSNLQLDQLSPELNIIHGPNGTGKTTVTQFIRWALYGQRDEALRLYLSAGLAAAGGRVSARHEQHEFTIHRHDDGTATGRAWVTSELSDTRHALDSRRLLGGVCADEFDRLCMLSFDRPLDLDGLIECGLGRGLELIGRVRPARKDERLQAEVEGLRRVLAGLPRADADIHTLRNRQQSQRCQLESALQTRCREQAALRDEYERLTAELQRLEEAQRWQQPVADQARTVLTQRDLIRERHASPERAVQEFLTQKRQQLSDMDTELSLWRQMLEQVTHARRQREVQLAAHGATPLASDMQTATGGPVCPVRPVAQRVRQLQHQYSAFPVPSPANDAAVAEPLVHALHGLQDEVGRLCEKLQDGRSAAAVAAMGNELRQLRICHDGLNCLLDCLGQRRQQVAGAIAAAERGAISAPDAALSPTRQPAGRNADASFVGPYPPVTCECLQPSRPPVSTHAHVPDAPQAPQPNHHGARDHQPSLCQLRQERQRIESRLQDLKNDPVIERLRRDLQHTESQLITLRERFRLRSTIRSLTQQSPRQQHQESRPLILQEASAMLRQLTSSRYAGMHITKSRQLRIDASSGPAVPYEQLSHGTRDQVYLCLGLAMLAAYRREGIELPLILNDAFTNVDSDRAKAMAELIWQFAQEGNQVLLLTRQRHVAELFHGHDAAFFELGASQVETPSAALSLPRASRSHRPVASSLDGQCATDCQPALPQGKRPHVRRRRTADVVDPSSAADTALRIDGRTAKKLVQAGVKTVADVLCLDPEAVAADLADRHITAQTVRQWQAQARWMRSLPGLRAVDAWALVACDVMAPEQLAAVSPRTLCRQVERLIRAESEAAPGGAQDAPGLAVVTGWIRWARRTISRRAA